MYITYLFFDFGTRIESLESMIRHPATKDFSDPVQIFTIVSWSLAWLRDTVTRDTYFATY